MLIQSMPFGGCRASTPTEPWLTIHALRHGPCLTCPLPACRRYRMRWHRFVLLKPFILLAVVPLERSLCRQACDTMPGAHVLTSRPSSCL